MKTFTQYLDALDEKQGYFPEDAPYNLRVTVSKLEVDYLRTVSVKGKKSLTRHINEAMSLYIDKLSAGIDAENLQK